MTTLREAAQQALEYMKSVGQMDMYPEEWAIVERLEAALAEPVGETTLDVSGATCFSATPAKWPEPLKAEMPQDDIIRLAREAGFDPDTPIKGTGEILAWEGHDCVEVSESLKRFAALVAAAEREKVARWIIHKGYATGHGDTIEDLLTELEWQVAEREREACAKVCDGWMHANGNDCAEAIRARGEA
jgi:hypothetical protein